MVMDGSCGKKQDPPVQVSRRHPTEFPSLEELLKRLQDRHVEFAQAGSKKAAADAQTTTAAASPDTPNVLQAMMELEKDQNRAKSTDKVALESEKEKDTTEKEVEELKRQLQPKRAHTHDAGDDREMLAEVDNWDLSVHRREATRMQNRRNVALGSLQDQPKSHTGKDGFLIHVRLGLVGWIFVLNLTRTWN